MMLNYEFKDFHLSLLVQSYYQCLSYGLKLLSISILCHKKKNSKEKKKYA